MVSSYMPPTVFSGGNIVKDFPSGAYYPVIDDLLHFGSGHFSGKPTIQSSDL
jgi:hypothetical protein